MPSVLLSGGTYRHFWTDEGSGATHFSTDATIGLTLLGWGHIAPLQPDVIRYLAVVRVLAQLRRLTPADPYVADDPVVAWADIKADPAIARLALDDEGTRLVLEHEPPTWGLLGDRGTAGDWTVYLRRRLRGFEHPESLTDYIRHIGAQLGAEVPSATAPPPPSPLTLTASLDYFDVAWQLRTGEGSLLRLPGAERTAGLAFDATSMSELGEGLAALTEVFKGLAVPRTPGIDGHPLARLRAWFIQRVESTDAAITDDAFDILEAIVQMRHGVLHAGPSVPLPESCRTLGVPWPITDPGRTWAIVQVRTVSALDVLRSVLPQRPT